MACFARLLGFSGIALSPSTTHRCVGMRYRSCDMPVQEDLRSGPSLRARMRLRSRRSSLRRRRGHGGRGRKRLAHEFQERADTTEGAAWLALEATQSRVGIVDEAAAASALRERHKTDPLQSDDDRSLRVSTLDDALETFD